MFSVIIPIYNKALYIAKAVQSVLAQTCQEFELIVVNDGSTDGSLEVVQRFNGSTVRQFKIINQPNAGVSIARNNGVKAAQYDYIAFLDADDWWEPTFLEEMKTLIEEFSSAGVYGCEYYIIKNGKKRIAPIGITPTFEKGLINYFKVYVKTLCMPLWTGAVIIKKSVFEEIKCFKPQLKLGEDFDLWFRIALKFPVAFLNKSLAYYNQDVELQHRAIGGKLYEPSEHMLFSDYGELNNNADFVFLFERLSLYSLLPYYLTGKNKKKVDGILSKIDWMQHEFKYQLYYRILPKTVIKLWMKFLKIGAKIKSLL
ncbi:MAG: glycosyltransferase [Bacteroidales bacterium]|jgi:glycosyltransferase involved in cell wall biosynthesis